MSASKSLTVPQTAAPSRFFNRFDAIQGLRRFIWDVLNGFLGPLDPELPKLVNSGIVLRSDTGICYGLKCTPQLRVAKCIQVQEGTGLQRLVYVGFQLPEARGLVWCLFVVLQLTI